MWRANILSSDPEVARESPVRPSLVEEVLPRRLADVPVPQVSSPQPSPRTHNEEQADDGRKDAKESRPKRGSGVRGNKSLGKDQVYDIVQSCLQSNPTITSEFSVREQTIVSLYEDIPGCSFRFHIPSATTYLTEDVVSRQYMIEIFSCPHDNDTEEDWEEAWRLNMPQARAVLGSKVPTMATHGATDGYQDIGYVSYVVWEIPEEQEDLLLLADCWEDMSHANKENVAKQIADVQQRLSECKFEEEADDGEPEAGRAGFDARLSTPDEDKWVLDAMVQDEQTGARRRERRDLQADPGTAWLFSLLEPFASGLEPVLVLLWRSSYFIQTGDAQAVLSPDHIRELRRHHLRLAHLGLTPENIVVRRTPRRFRSGPRYEIAHVLNWTQSLRYAPPLLAAAALDARLGRGSVKDASYYHLTRGSVDRGVAVSAALPLAAALNIAMAAHLLREARRSEYRSTAQRAMQAKREKWLGKRKYVFQGPREGYVKDVLLHRFLPGRKA